MTTRATQPPGVPGAVLVRGRRVTPGVDVSARGDAYGVLLTLRHAGGEEQVLLSTGDARRLVFTLHREALRALREGADA